ncbi:dual OB domain-containing protein [Photobacterium damselae]|uniref:Dual OB-containing domain-containing protein n=1 Tax=Photobacterium damselae TaxID=38293 RepID=A0ABD6WZF4_PHODM|nr:hypothetical protein [Photobacterium damselae]OBU38802.1 hypothetical protein AYY27_11585 [Photobacterium damselae]PSU15065.1 hypothetical protein CTM90_18175 [Photobacterium damselae]
MKEYIITDLTRFSHNNTVCIALVDPETGDFVRPQPYIANENCKKLHLQPGAKIQGVFTPKVGAVKPHIEDSTYGPLRSFGPCSKEEFKGVLEKTLFPSVPKGFGVEFEKYQKLIKNDDAPERSIITIKINPKSLSIHEDQYNKGKIKASFTDAEGNYFSYLSITDRRFFDYAKKHFDDGKLDTVVDFLHAQEELYLRVGLSRHWKHPSDGREGYWLQVNGIYTFPSYPEEINLYE